jgi:3-oxoacyl-[acyl-carrier protein] reductase
MKLQSRTALVTGAASGIGEAIAALFAEEGALVAGLDLKPSRCAVSLEADVTDEPAVAGAIARAVAAMGRIDILSTNAGIAIRRPIDELSSEDWDRVVAVNLRGVFLSTKYSLPHIPRGGSVIHMASGVGLVGIRNRAVYSATKGALISLTRNMALDYAGRGIRVNCICPGFTRTPLTEKLFSDPAKEAQFTALHRDGGERDIALAALFLASATCLDHGRGVAGGRRFRRRARGRYLRPPGGWRAWWGLLFSCPPTAASGFLSNGRMELSDALAVAQARAGDADAFRVLVERHSRYLFRVAYRMTGNEQDAEDIVQETFAGISQSGSYDGRAAFTSWLFPRAHNYCSICCG